MALDGTKFQQIHEALLDAYRDEQSLREMYRIVLRNFRCNQHAVGVQDSHDS